MKKAHFKSLSSESAQLLSALQNEVTKKRQQNQRETIASNSPYSPKINDRISSYEELYRYASLGLKEAEVTRLSLVREIDPNLYVSVEERTNLQLMTEGRSPYAYDAEDGRIELHHIGQGEDAPFAELTDGEHSMYGNSKILHDLKIDSWRQSKSALSAFYKEREIYWQMRASGDITFLPMKETETPKKDPTFSEDELSNEILYAIELLLSECSLEDLGFIGDLAYSYSLIKRIGVTSISEYKNHTAINSGEAICCTYCGSNDYVSYGSYFASEETVQRYKCKNCEKTFTRVNRSIISGSNLTFTDWMKLIDCLYNGYSIPKTAVVCGMTEKAVQHNRYKLFYALKLLDDQVKLAGNIVIDETYIDTSFKGNHSSLNFELPRRAHKRGHGRHLPGTSKDKVGIVCALDEDGNSVERIAGCGGATTRELKEALKGSINKKDVFRIYADKESALTAYAKMNDLPIKQGQLLKKRRNKKGLGPEAYIINNYLQTMNSYHSRLKDFLRRFSGTSSKYLAGYLYLFSWKERNKHRDIEESYTELLQVMTQPNRYLTIEEITSGKYMPDPITLHNRRKASFQDLEQAHKRYAMYAAGMTYAQIARTEGVSRQTVFEMIKKYKTTEFAYKTIKEKQKEEALATPQLKKYYHDASPLLAIYEDWKQWTGSPTTFEDAMMKKYKIARQTVKNRVVKARRLMALREEFYIHEEHVFKDLKEVYTEIYTRFQEVQNDGIQNKKECYDRIASESGYSPKNISKIIQLMSQPNPHKYFEKKRKLSKLETITRDKALFIDFLKYPGTRAEFCVWASKKYGLATNYIHEIITACIMADPKRGQIV